MKKHYTMKIALVVLLTSVCLPSMAQLTGTGFYRFRNVETSEYISMANDKFSYQFLFGSSQDSYFNAPQVGGGLGNLSDNTSTVKSLIFNGAEIFLKNAIHLVDADEVDCISPSTILYIKNSSGSLYNIISQGTSLLTLTTGSYKASVELIFNDIYATISRSSGTGANAQYTASVNIAASDIENISYSDWKFALGKSLFLSQAKLGAYYFYDNNGTFSINSSSSATNAKWYIEPITQFNVKPEVSYGSNYYTTLYVPFAYKLSGQVKNAYAITNINSDGTMEYEVVATNGETVPAGTTVILECGSDAASECILELVNSEPIYTAAASKVQYAPTSSTSSNYQGDNLLKGAYFSNQDTPFEYQYNRSGTSTSTTLNLQNYTTTTEPQKYVLGLTASGKLGFVQATGTAMPANKAWIEYTGSAELVLPTLMGDVNRDGEVTIADVTALVNIILGKATEGDSNNYDFKAANVNGDKTITIADVTALVNIILGKE